MSVKKGVLFGVVVLVVMFSVLLVNAGWWQTITGKAISDSTAKVEISGSLFGPVIPNVSQVNRIGQPGASTVSLLNKGAGTGIDFAFTPLNFTFYAYSPGGYNLLPITNGPSGKVITNVIARVNGSVGGVNTFFFASCSFVDQIPDLRATLNNNPGIPVGTQGANYSCTFNLSYYYDVGKFIINVTIIDLQSTPKQGSNATLNFDINPLYSWSNSPQSMNWSGLQLGDPNPRPADYNMSIYNNGNVDIGSGVHRLYVNASSLYGLKPLYQTQYINSSNFTVAGSPVNPCTTGLRLVDFQDKEPPSFLVDHKLSTVSLAAFQNLSFCITPNNIIGIESQIYSANPNDNSRSKTWVLRTQN